jgi:hypothetical protein
METTVVDKVIIDLTHVGDEIRVTQRQIPFQQGDIVRLKEDSTGYWGKDSLIQKALSSKKDYKVIKDDYDRVLIKLNSSSYIWIKKDSVSTHKTQLNIRYED